MSLAHSDFDPRPHVTLPGNLLPTEFQCRLAALEPPLVFLFNVLEHLPRPTRRPLPGIREEALPPGACLVVGVPYSYPYHADPIDTMYWPSRWEWAAAFREGFRPLADIVRSQTYDEER